MLPFGYFTPCLTVRIGVGNQALHILNNSLSAIRREVHLVFGDAMPRVCLRLAVWPSRGT